MKLIVLFTGIAAATAFTAVPPTAIAAPVSQSPSMADVGSVAETPSLVAVAVVGNAPHDATPASGPRSSVASRGAVAAAARSPEALRRYVHRTRMVYALDAADFVPR